MNIKRIFNLLLFLSFLFLFFYLLKQDYIVPVISNYYYLGISFVCLYLGFYVQALSWKVALRSHGMVVGRGDAVISHGLPVFAKYIPGKIWVILGRASYLSKDKSDLKIKSFISLKEQLIYLWTGFMLSAVPTLVFYGFGQWISLLVLLIIIGLTLLLFVQKVHNWMLLLASRILKKEVEIPLLKFRQSLPMIGAVMWVWICWTAGFYLFMLAFSQKITLVMMFAFPLSVCFGLIAIILPAGLGLREGIIVGYLTLAGLEIESATTIAFVNRLWFISGEVFMFLLAFLTRLFTRRPGTTQA